MGSGQLMWWSQHSTLAIGEAKPVCQDAEGSTSYSTLSTGPQKCLCSCSPSPWVTARPTECKQLTRGKKVFAQKERGDSASPYCLGDGLWPTWKHCTTKEKFLTLRRSMLQKAFQDCTHNAGLHKPGGFGISWKNGC